MSKARTAGISEKEALTRAMLAGREHHCCCRGWAVFERGGTHEIMTCDECTSGLPITDSDVAALPEAQEALKRVMQRRQVRADREARLVAAEAKAARYETALRKIGESHEVEVMSYRMRLVRCKEIARIALHGNEEETP